MYTLNGIHSDLGVKEQYLEDGDEIVFHYTDDYRKEHEHEWSESWSYDSESHWHECVSRYGTCDITDNAKKGGYQKHTMEKEGSKRSYLQSRRKEGIYLSGVRLYEDGNHSKNQPAYL